MYIGKTLFAQVMDFLPWKTFHRIVDRCDGDRYVKSMTCAEQFRVMAFAQLTYRESLRDIEACLSAQAAKHYHMGFRHEIKRATLADANESRDWRIHAEFAQLLIGQARKLYSGDSFGIELENTAYALDSTTIDLCLSLFPWALFRTTKSAVKMHTLLDLRGNIPSFIHISDGKLGDVNVLDVLVIEAGVIYVMDRGYLDFTRLYRMHQAQAFFVTRAKSNTKLRRIYSAKTDRNAGIICDQTIALTGTISCKDYPEHLRRIRFKDPKTGKTLVFLTNNFIFPAATICALYKARWQVELFFKWIKQHLVPQGDFLRGISRSSTAIQRMQFVRKSGLPCRSMSSLPSSRSASTWTPHSTLCYRSCRLPCSRRCLCSKPFRASTTKYLSAYLATK